MLAGSLLTALGILALLFHNGIQYTSHEKYPPGGATQIITHQERYLSIPPLAAGAMLAGGVAIMILAARK
jgi:hypothetical protein